MVDAGNLRLCFDRANGMVHQEAGADPVVGLKVRSIEQTISALQQREIPIEKGPVSDRHGRRLLVRDPDGRPVIFTETD